MCLILRLSVLILISILIQTRISSLVEYKGTDSFLFAYLMLFFTRYDEFKFGCTSLRVPPDLLYQIRHDITVSPSGVAFVKVIIMLLCDRHFSQLVH